MGPCVWRVCAQVLDQRLEAIRAEKTELYNRFQDTVFKVQQKAR